MNVDYENAYYGKNYEYVMKNSKEDVDMMKKKFLKKISKCRHVQVRMFCKF